MALTNTLGTEVLHIKIDGAAEAEDALKGVEGASAGVEGQTKKTDKATDDLGSRFKSMGKDIAIMSAGLIGLQSAAAAFSTAMSAIKGGVNLAVDFERQFAQIKTLNRDIGDDLRQELLSLASELPQSASDIAQSAYAAISAGIEPTDVVDFLKSASFAATAAGGTMSEAVGLLTTGVNAFGKQGETAASIANKLFATVRGGVTTIPELNQIFGRASAAASSYGISVDEVLGAIALMTKQGIPSAQAVSRIDAALAELANSTGTASKALKDHNVEVGVQALQQKGLIGVLGEINEATKGQASEVAKLTGSQMGLQALLMMTGDGFAEYQKSVNTVKTDTEALGDANKDMSSTTQHVIDLFNSAKEGAFRAMGEEVLPALRDLLVSITSELGSSGSGFRTFGKFIGGVVKTLELFTNNLGKIATAMTLAFAMKFKDKFISGLIDMRVALQKFSAMSDVEARLAGHRYGAGFAKSAGKFLASPMGAGLIAFGVMAVIDSINEKRAKKEKEEADKRKGINREELAVFIKNEEIKMSEVNKRLKLGEREKTVSMLRIAATQALLEGDRERSQALQQVSIELENMTGTIPNLDEMFDKSKESTKEMLSALSELPPSVSGVISSFQEASSKAQTMDERIALVNQAMNQLGQISLASEDAIMGFDDALELGTEHANEQDIQMKELEATFNRLTEIYNNSDQSAGGVVEAFDMIFDTSYSLAAQIEDTKRQMEILQAEMDVASGVNAQLMSSVDDLGRSYSSAGDEIYNLTTELENLQAIQDEEAQYQLHIMALEETLLTKRQKAHRQIALQHKEALDRQREANNPKGIAAINKFISLQQREWDQANRKRKKYYTGGRRSANTMMAAEKKIQETIRETAKIYEESRNIIKAGIRDYVEQSEAAEIRLNLAKLDANKYMDPVAKLIDRFAQEEKLAQNQYNSAVKRIEDERDAEIRNAEMASKEKLKHINSSVHKKKRAEARKQEGLRHKAALDQIRVESEARLDLLDLEEKSRKQVSGIERGAELQEATHAASLSDSDRDLSLIRGAGEEAKLQGDLDRRLFFFDLETKALHDKLLLDQNYIMASMDQQIEMERQLGAARLRLRKKVADEMRTVSLQENASAAQGVANSLSTMASLSEALGGSDSFVGKIQAAQIMADGVFHAFQGASDQAKALSAFATPGGTAQGIGFQAAALAHFAQAAVAPIMARRAMHAGRGGGTASAAGGGGASAAGPRRPATDIRAEAASQQSAGIQFGDIILADVPALLSRSGSRQLAGQIAGDIARALNRQRALPGGSRI